MLFSFYWSDNPCTCSKFQQNCTYQECFLPGVVVYSFSLRAWEADLCKTETSLTYIVSSRSAGTTGRVYLNPHPPRKKKNVSCLELNQQCLLKMTTAFPSLRSLVKEFSKPVFPELPILKSLNKVLLTFAVSELKLIDRAESIKTETNLLKLRVDS